MSDPTGESYKITSSIESIANFPGANRASDTLDVRIVDGEVKISDSIRLKSTVMDIRDPIDISNTVDANITNTVDVNSPSALDVNVGNTVGVSSPSPLDVNVDNQPSVDVAKQPIDVDLVGGVDPVEYGEEGLDITSGATVGPWNVSGAKGVLYTIVSEQSQSMDVTHKWFVGGNNSSEMESVTNSGTSVSQDSTRKGNQFRIDITDTSGNTPADANIFVGFY